MRNWLQARYLAAFLLALGLAGVFVAQAFGSTGATTTQPPSVALPQQAPPAAVPQMASVTPDPHSLQLFQTTTLPDGEKLPRVVARVGNSEITSTAFAHQVALVTDNAKGKNPNWSKGRIWKTALKALIQDAALYERAKAEGITVSDAELAAFVAKQEAALAQSELTDPTAAARVQAAVLAAGDADYASFMRDPKILDTYRRDLMKGKLVDAHLGKSATADKINTFIGDTIGQANVQVLIVMPA